GSLGDIEVPGARRACRRLEIVPDPLDQAIDQGLPAFLLRQRGVVGRGRRRPVGAILRQQRRDRLRLERIVIAALAFLAAAQDGAPGGVEHAMRALRARVLFLLRHADVVAAEQVDQQLAGAARAALREVALERGNNRALDQLPENVVAGDAEAFAKRMYRDDLLAALDEIRRDHQVGGAAADVDAGDPDRRPRTIHRRIRLL